MNNTVRYAAGDWFLVARERGFALLPNTVPVSLLETVWETLDGGGGLAGVIDKLTGAYGMSLSAIPPFAMAIMEQDDLRVAVRGGVRVAYDDGTRQDLITGGRVQTWVEQAIPPYATIVVTPPGARIEETMLPIASGVVRTGLVTIGTPEARPEESVEPLRRRRRKADGTQAGEHDDDAGVDEQVADAAAVNEVEEALAPDPREAADEDLAAADSEAPTADAAAPQDVDEAEQADESADAENVAEEAPATDGAEGTEPDVQPDGAADVVDDVEREGAEQPEAGALPDDEQAAAATPADEQRSTELTDEVVDEQFAEIRDRELTDEQQPVGDHDGHTLEHAFMRALRDDEPEAAAAAETQSPVSTVFRGRAVLSTGRVLTLDRVLVVGRRPRVTRTSTGAVPALVAVDSPTHDISRNHIEIRRDGESVLVTDLNTTNGTVLLRDGEDPRRLHPGEAMLVVSGDVIDIGDEVTVTFEEIH